MTSHHHRIIDDWLEELISGPQSLVLLGQDQRDLEWAALKLREGWLTDLTHTLQEFNALEYEQILGRLNRLLNLQVTPSPSQLPGFSEPLDLWIIHNAQMLSPEQMHLLGQILALNPGLNLRWILMYRGDETPRAWLEATRHQTRTQHCTDLNPSSTLSTSTDKVAIHDSVVETAALARPNDSAPPVNTGPHAQARKHTLLKHLSLAVIYLSIGCVAGRWSAPAKIETEVIIEPAATAPEGAIMPSVTQAPVKSTPADASTPEVATAKTNTTATLQPQTEPTPTIQSMADKHAMVELKTDMSWLKELSPEYFVIAHGTFRKLENAKNFKDNRAELSKARVVPLWVNRRLAFAVITGPFRSENRAENNLKKFKWSANAKVMPTMQAQKLMQAAQQASD
jgi:hypothetical protein